MSEQEYTASAIRGHIARGTAWMVAMRWGIRAIGFVNVLILARLLTPEDFGLVAMAMVVVGFLEALSTTGVDLALLRKPNVTQGEYDTAWTIQVLIGFVKFAVLVVSAPFLASYYGDARVENIIYVISLKPLISGFTNIGIVDFRRNFNFAKDFRFWTYIRLLSFILVIGFVFYFRNYWALVIGAPLTAVITVALSYKMSSFRPRLSLRNCSELFNFAKWRMLLGTVMFAGRRGDEFILGGFVSPTHLGAYFIASDIGRLATVEIVGPSTRSSIPALGKMDPQSPHLARNFFDVLAMVALILVPAGVGLSAIADEFVPVVLGAQWAESAPLLAWLAPAAVAVALMEALQPYLLIRRQERTYTLMYVFHTAVLLSMVGVAASLVSLETIAALRMVFAIATVFAIILVLSHEDIIPARQILRCTWRPIMASLVMWGILQAGVWDTLSLPMWFLLVIKFSSGVIIYFAALVALWIAGGKRPGAEALLIRKTADSLRKNICWQMSRWTS